MPGMMAWRGRFFLATVSASFKDSTKSEEETREKQMDKGSRSQVQSSSWTCDDSDDTLQQAKQEDPFGR